MRSNNGNIINSSGQNNAQNNAQNHSSFEKSVTSIHKTAILPALVQEPSIFPESSEFIYEKQDSYTQTATAAQVPTQFRQKSTLSNNHPHFQQANPSNQVQKPRRKFKTKHKIQPASCWHWESNHPWYGCNGKGTGWRFLLGPIIFVIGPLVHFWRAFNLDLRVSNCWDRCWFWDTNFEWFECNGKGRGWIALLVPLYILLFPILAVMTMFTVVCLAFCGGMGDKAGRQVRVDSGRIDDEHSV